MHYYYHNQSSLKEIETSTVTTDTADLILPVDKFPDNATSSFKCMYKANLQPVFVPASAGVSPCIVDIEDEAVDSESLNNFNSKSRRASLNKAERRAEHNAIERARRECLNTKFLQLAEALPNLQNLRRPSKGQIVEKALDWVKQNISREDRYQYQIMQLQDENKRLVNQINIAQEPPGNNIVTPPFSAGLFHQQFPANSIPTAAGVPTFSDNKDSKSKITSYYSQDDDMNMMYTMAPLEVANQHTVNHIKHSTSSSSSSRFLYEDDNESSSSNEQAQSHHIRMPFNNGVQHNTLEMSHTLSSGTSTTWDIIQQHPHYPCHPLSYSSLEMPSTENGIYYSHNNVAYSS